MQPNLMIEVSMIAHTVSNKSDVKRITRELNVPYETVEKDYAIGWMVKAILKHFIFILKKILDFSLHLYYI